MTRIYAFHNFKMHKNFPKIFKEEIATNETSIIFIFQYFNEMRFYQ